MNHTIISFLLVFGILNITASADNDDNVIIKYSLKNKAITVKIIVKRGVFYIANPDFSNTLVQLKDKQGVVRISFYSQHQKGPIWKHIIILSKPREEATEIGEYKFMVDTSDVNFNPVSNTIKLWVCGESAFDGSPIPDLDLKELSNSVETP